MRRFYYKQTRIESRSEKDLSKVEIALQNNAMRHQVFHLLSSRNDLERKARFCSAVLEFARTTDKSERLAKGRKIVVSFANEGSLFHVDMPDGPRCELLQGRMKALEVVRALFVEELLAYEPLISELPNLWDKVYQCQEL